MPRHSSYRTNHGIDAVGSDWSSSQLIIGIAVAIVFGVTCFATGYVIALYDNPLETASANTENGEQAATPPTPTPVPPPAPSAAPAASDAKPAPEKVPAKETPAPAPTEVASATKPPAQAPTPVPVPAPEPAKPVEPIQRTGLRPTTIDALPEPGGPTPMVRTTVDLNKAPAPKIEPMDPDASTAVPGITPPTPTEKPAVVASNVPAITPPSEKKTESAVTVTPPAVTPPATKTAEVKPPASKTPPVTPPDPKAAAKTAKDTKESKETKEAAATPTVTKGSFGIQVASFDGPQRSTQAKDFQRNLKTKAQQNADIIVTADGTYHKVVITGYDSRDAAKAACEKMKSKPGLEGAWVVRLP